MSQRFVAIIDADLQFANYLHEELARYGLGVEVTVDSNELMARKDGLPDLVVLCIDPKRTGWAVCNRLRKSPLLRSVPLIITSAEATEKDFDDHKKLKTRAEEYLHKPFNAEALVDKIGGLIGMPQAVEPEVGEIEIEPDEIGVVEPYAADEMTGDGTATPGSASFDGPTGTFDAPSDDESTRIGFTTEIDGEVDLETNAAFAAIGLDDPIEGTGPQAASPFDDDPFGLPEPPPVAAAAPAVAATVTPAAIMPPPRARVSDAPADLDSAPIPRLSAEELGIGLEEVQRDAAALVASTPSPRPAIKPDVADESAVDEARREIERLKKENEELRARPKAEPAGSTSFSREREFLNLRETINKKEKDVLDLKDTLDSKERVILDGKEKLRDVERRLREVEERSLATERELVAAREKVEALSADKERGVEREKQVKGRLEDTQKAQQRAEAEVEQWRGKHAADTTALDEKYNQTVATHREELATLRTSHAESLAALKSEHTTAISAENSAHEEEQRAQAQSHAAALAQLRSEHADMVAGLRERHEQEQGQRASEHRATMESELKAAERRQGEAIVDLEAKHEAALRAQGDEARRTLEQAVADHLGERSRLEADHARAVETLDVRKAEELAAAAAQAAADVAAALAAAAEEQAQALAKRGSEHEAELKAAREQHARKLQALEESHDDLKAGMQARHATQLEDLRKQHTSAVTEHEASIAERDQVITQQRERQAELDSALAAEQEQGKEHSRQIGALEGELEAARGELETRQGKLDERARRIGELEQESARYQDQILRAYQRIKSDESIVARAKKALAIALTLLEESDTDSSEEAKS